MTVRRFLIGLTCAAGVLVALLFVAQSATARQTVAQISVPTAAPPGAPAGIVQQGNYVTAPIVIDGVPVLRIAAPITASVAQLPIAARVADVQTALEALLAETGTDAHATTIFNPNTLRVHIRRIGDAVVLEAVDAKHLDPLPILTVTAVDARANAVSVDVLASEWQPALQSALVRALLLRQPAFEQRNVQRVIRLAIVMVASSFILFGVLRELWRRMAVVEVEIDARERAVDAIGPVVPEQAGASLKRRRLFAFRIRTLEPAQRLNQLRMFVEILLWVVGLGWFVGVTWGLSLFAETTPLSQLIARRAFGVATTIIVAGLLNRLLDAIIARGALAWRLRRFTTSEDRARLLLRVPTIARALAGSKTFVLVFVAALSALGQVGVPIGSVVTIGGLAAIALSLAAQNFVRDFLNGFLVLFEDQYVVGDFVTINTFSGLVERLTLRMVQLRDAAGDVITISHSSVANVVNQSRNWSRVDYRVPVDPAADIDQAIELVRAQITALAAADDWMLGVAQPIEWIGIDALSRDAIVVRASVKTAPLRQFELRRQINDRVRTAFHAAGIALGAPLL